MAEIRLHDTPVCHSREFYQTRDAVDHIKRPADALRLLVLSAYVVYYSRFDRNVQDKPFPKIGDFGCGTGGLMKYISGLVPARCELYGYDLSPEAVNYAQGIRFLDVQLKDFVNEKVEYPDIMIVSEVLEHLPDPHGFLRKIPKETIVVASVPAQETETRHDETHNWIWTENSFEELFIQTGYFILNRGGTETIQIIVARKAV